MDLDLFERNHHRRRAPTHRRDATWSRRRHPHIFSWVLLAGGVLLLCLAGLALASWLGAWGALSDAYFAATTALLPASWHDEWLALPGVAHVALALAALFVVTGVLGELFD